LTADRLVVSWFDQERDDDVWGRWYELPPPFCSLLPDAAKCDGELDALCMGTEDARSLGDQDKLGLLGKVQNTVEKVNQSKYRDALAKLSDFQTNLRSLEKEGKTDEAEANLVLSSLTAAVSCIRQLKQRVRH
jgi:hypothetical protein